MTQAGIGEPLVLAPTFDPKPWGGRRLAGWGKSLPDGLIGESLESGGSARVTGGRFDGQLVSDLVTAHPRALLGERGLAASGPFGDFPLLVKLIDASEDLSIQVHPDDDNAPASKRGKTEAWLILQTTPEASLITGLRGEFDPARIEQGLIRRSVEPGEVYFVPAGTVHAIGAGVLLYEVQQASDVTYRIYDWGRPRETHIDEARRVLRENGEALRTRPLSIDDQRTMLVACRYFALERWQIDHDTHIPSRPETFRVVTVLGGAMTLAGRAVAPGVSLILPADLPDVVCEGAGQLLVAYIPDLQRDVIEPLVAAGHALKDIALLGVGIDR